MDGKISQELCTKRDKKLKNEMYLYFDMLSIKTFLNKSWI